MKTDFRARVAAIFAVATLSSLASNCGIEVGNPHPKPGTGSGGTGALTLALADAPVDDARHVYLNIIGMRVVPELSTGVYSEPIAVTLANAGKIDALALSGGKSLELSAAQAIAPGSYAGVILDLDQADPATIVAADGTESPMALADAGRGIFVAQGFEAVDGEDLKITLHVDLRRSIKALDEGGARTFKFGPVAHMVRQGDEAQLTGAGVDASLTTVCAYLRRTADFNGGEFGRIPRHGEGGKLGMGEGGSGEHHDDRHGGGPGAPPPRFDGGRPHLDARLPPSIAPGADVTPDADSGCDNAFATAAVSGGAFLLSHLWPGEYHVQFYKADGSAAAAAIVVAVKPGEKADVPPPPAP